MTTHKVPRACGNIPGHCTTTVGVAMLPQYSPLVTSRFWNYVAKTATCWLWNGGRSPSGYGKFRVGRQSMRAHRVAWELTHGVIPQGMLVCHHCDNPPCVRPDHLFLGDSHANSTDSARKGRTAFQRHPAIRYEVRGEQQHLARLTALQVQAIRARYAKGETNKSQLAREFGVSTPTIRHLLNGRTWNHVP